MFHTHQISTSLFMYNLSTLLFGCNAPYVVIVFLDLLSTSFNSLSFHCSIPASYLNTATTHAFIAVILFFPFSFDFRTNQSLIFLDCYFFHFIFIDFIQFNYAQTCVSFLFDLLHYFTIWQRYSFTCNFLIALDWLRTRCSVNTNISLSLHSLNILFLYPLISFLSSTKGLLL